MKQTYSSWVPTQCSLQIYGLDVDKIYEYQWKLWTEINGEEEYYDGYIISCSRETSVGCGNGGGIRWNWERRGVRTRKWEARFGNYWYDVKGYYPFRAYAPGGDCCWDYGFNFECGRSSYSNDHSFPAALEEAKNICFGKFECSSNGKVFHDELKRMNEEIAHWKLDFNKMYVKPLEDLQKELMDLPDTISVDSSGGKVSFEAKYGKGHVMVYRGDDLRGANEPNPECTKNSATNSLYEWKGSNGQWDGLHMTEIQAACCNEDGDVTHYRRHEGLSYYEAETLCSDEGTFMCTFDQLYGATKKHEVEINEIPYKHRVEDNFMVWTKTECMGIGKMPVPDGWFIGTWMRETTCDQLCCEKGMYRIYTLCSIRIQLIYAQCN